jgi:hypothetical protein
VSQWYYNDGGEQRGPVTRERLTELLGAGKLDADTLVWQEGMSDWKPASALPGFAAAAPPASSPYAPPQAAPDAEVAWHDHEATGHQVRPWIRYWARTADFLIFAMFGGIGIGIAAPHLVEIPDQLYGMLLLVLYVFFEPVLLSTFGTTPFRAILNVRIRNRDGSKLTYGQALKRSLLVFVKGSGLGIPLVSLITHLYSYNRLTGRGITSWDESGGFIVSHQTIPWWRWMLLIGAFVTFVYFISLGLSEAGLNG